VGIHRTLAWLLVLALGPDQLVAGVTGYLGTAGHGLVQLVLKTDHGMESARGAVYFFSSFDFVLNRFKSVQLVQKFIGK
jgi:hypothetical protein